RGAIDVAAKFLQLRDAELLQRIRNGGTDASVVLVIVRAFEFHVLTVEEKSFVSVETDRADAKSRFITVHHRAAGLDRRDELVQLRRFDGPELGIGDGQDLAELSTRPGGEFQSFG